MKKSTRERDSYEWWIHEGGICEKEGHPMAARTAYNQAVLKAPDEYRKGLAQQLFDGVKDTDS